MRICGKTDKGFKRPDNQDRYISGELANGTSFGFVCDGMGGAKGGSTASSHLCKILEEYLFLQNDNKAINPEKTVLDAIDTACSDLYYKSQKDEALRGMGTTISGITVKDDKCITYNAGDSRVYVLRSDTLTQVTEDHSVVQQLYRRGAISAQEVLTHPKKNLITRAVGVQDTVQTDVSEFTLQKGDRILCCSDGLTNFVSGEEITDILSSEDFFEIPEKLIQKALVNNASDNITAVVLEY